MLYSLTADKGSPEIQRPRSCSSRIGAGGSLIEGQQRYAGKCHGAGNSPELAGSKDKYLKFSTDQSHNKKETTRTELAITQEYFQFNRLRYIGFKLRIPEGTSDTNEFFYLMQMWQCSPASPIMGIRLDRGKGGSHSINFMTRNDHNNTGGRRFLSYDLTPGKWHSFVIAMQPSSRGRFGKSRMSVWADGKRNSVTEAKNIGNFKKGRCEGGKRPPQHYRIKFGIYKGGEPGKRFEVHYDDIKVGDWYKDVVPW
ncbi:MAG: heparin lyase I family protein [Bdellovibrionales bacterium]|nr:heparin lyase I family protein [Bdellovibrionales bacterium]